MSTKNYFTLVNCFIVLYYISHDDDNIMINNISDSPINIVAFKTLMNNNFFIKKNTVYVKKITV